MGAMCGKAQHFESEGHKLNTINTPRPNQFQPQPQPQPQSPPRSQSRLTQQVNNKTVSNQQIRQATAEAAEARLQAAKTRGGKGNLSKALAQQKSDGGRTSEAIMTGGNKTNSNSLVWD
ncbi:hypothetical protein CROQUDRAFT_653982 [Cronartium quercuum f. sp. fusiforme G11]|uniref:Uncharacterized protein n=1 Tax=Cronartium quercuum f. sp. fusiforme G11 TaxID=708437 RepID=A0A9P6NTD1_9BASI|nr:hypothetical protein CROQUDRAFT_653982 [Cronartium quercuum f. sp. fusiforme G11]